MPEWVQMLLIGTVILGLVAYVWRMHENHDQERIRIIWDQIGRDSESGMRRVVHDTHNKVSLNHDAIERAEDRLDRLERRIFGDGK
jgi:hypothetical protein